MILLSYPKIPSLYDTDKTAGIWEGGRVYVQEKVDGSLFRIYWSKSALLFGSKSVDYYYTSETGEVIPKPVDKMFTEAKESAVKVLDGKDPPFTCTIFSEYLRAPKHNTLKYARIPKNHLMVFDVYNHDTGKFLLPEEVVEFAWWLDLEPVNILGTTTSPEFLRPYLDRESFLGGVVMEGVVIKNYSKLHGPGDGHPKCVDLRFPFPFFAKLVRDEFKEKNKIEWKVKANPVEAIGESFANKNKWLKAYYHLREQGRLTGTMQDLAIVIPEIQKDIEEEDSEYIKEQLYQAFIHDILRKAVKGVPEWYRGLIEDKKA